jgi:alkylation response protein AidB-like acyl-CoA dehydrogenase
VKFSFSSEQEEFRSNLRRLLADRSPTKEVRRLMETDQGYEGDGWRAINTALGLTAIRIPEAYGGYAPCSAHRILRRRCWPPAPS